MYLTVALTVSMLRMPSLARGAAVGAKLDLTMLKHTAPTILLVAIMTYDVLRALTTRTSRDSRKQIASAAAIAASVACLVASPFLLAVVVHYRCDVKNKTPLKWLAPELHLEHLSDVFVHLL